MTTVQLFFALLQIGLIVCTMILVSMGGLLMDYRQTYTLPDAVYGDTWLQEVRLHTTNETLLQTDLQRMVIEWSKASTTSHIIAEKLA